MMNENGSTSSKVLKTIGPLGYRATGPGPLIGKTQFHCLLSKMRHCSYLCNQGFGNTSLGTRKKKYSLNNRISYADIYLIVKFRKMITI